MAEELKKLLKEAESWGNPDELIGEDGHLKVAYDDWTDRVKQVLRHMPEAYETTRKFLRLQRFYNHTWTPDLASDEDREKLTIQIIKDSIEYIEELTKTDR